MEHTLIIKFTTKDGMTTYDMSDADDLDYWLGLALDEMHDEKAKINSFKLKRTGIEFPKDNGEDWEEI